MDVKKSYITFSHKIKVGTLIVLINCVFTFLLSCGSNSSNVGLSEENDNEKSKYPDGEYCADVTYYNPNTGTRNTYTLNVEVEGNELTQINWPNGGWLDDSHFTPEELDDGGSCSFTSDRGYEYEVQITGPPCFSTDERKARYDKEESTCPKCGEEKFSYDKYCDDCQDEICPKCGRDKYSWDEYCNTCTDRLENTCSRCGSIEYYVNGGLCSDCKRQDEEEEEERRRQDEDN